jgi:hypothetical protein
MKKWLVQVEFTASMEIAVDAENAREAEKKALGMIDDPEEFEVAHVEAFRDWDAEEEEEEFEPGRPILDQMALNP